ncbi:MAG: phage holin family protein [Candidatus Omnitrophica bacterium]|nr:phage holin family protein [Candidatus Omnitrophota bacterium]
MRGLLVRWGVNSLALLIVVHTVRGIEVANPVAVVVAALFLGILNAFLRPALILVTLPLNLITLGLFTFLINGFLLWLVGQVIKGFTVTGFWPAVAGSFLFSLMSFLISILIDKKGRLQVTITERQAPD